MVRSTAHGLKHVHVYLSEKNYVVASEGFKTGCLWSSIYFTIIYCLLIYMCNMVCLVFSKQIKNLMSQNNFHKYIIIIIIIIIISLYCPQWSKGPQLLKYRAALILFQILKIQENNHLTATTIIIICDLENSHMNVILHLGIIF